VNLNKILIIGSLPPPIGGVTIHVKRLLYHLDENEVPYKYIDLRNNAKISIIKLFLTHKRIHLHTSNVYLRFTITFIGILFQKKIDFTLHGDLGRYNSKFKNSLDIFAIYLAKIPILLNSKSLEKAKRYNKNSVIGSSFYSPNYKDELMNPQIISTILSHKNKFHFQFCTNAYNLSFDKEDQEIYGLFELIELFANYTQFSLVISDPSRAYHREILNRKIKLTKNILLISCQHSFYKVIEMSDGMIRNTTTDGDSISVKEGLYLNKLVYCTSVVERPKQVIIYSKGNFSSILQRQEFLKELKKPKSSKKMLERKMLDNILLYK